jgi:hypothetical protein
MHCVRSLERWDLSPGVDVLCAFILCVGRPCDRLITRLRSPTVCVKKDYQTKEEARAQQRAVEALMNE